MNQAPEERRPRQQEPKTVAFSSTGPHYNDDRVPPKTDRDTEREKKASISSPLDSEDDFFQLEPTVLGGPSLAAFADPPICLVSNIPTEPHVAPVEDSAKHFGDRRPPTPCRTDVPDPNRIPVSIFARSPVASPMEWSMASNESLFSIQMGSSSFSREHGLFLLGRSGDLGNVAVGPWDYPPPRPAALMAAAEGVGGLDRPVHVDEVEGKQGKEEEEKEGMLEAEWKEFSDGSSTTSLRSFAFPVLAGEEKNESIKFRHHQTVEHQPPAAIGPPKFSHPTPAAAAASPPTSTHASAKCRCLPCFSWRRLCKCIP